MQEGVLIIVRYVKSSNYFVITGKIASGKTTIINKLCFLNKNYVWISCDKIIHDSYKANSYGYNYIKKNIGEEFVNKNRVLRSKLFSYLLSNELILRKIESFLYNYLVDEINKILNNSKDKLCIIECPLKKQLLSNFQNIRIIHLDVTRDEQIKRLKLESRSNISNITEYVDFFNSQISENFYNYVYNIKTTKISKNMVVSYARRYIVNVCSDY